MSRVLYGIHEVNSPEQVVLRFRLQYTTNGEADFQVPAGAVSSNTRTGTGVYTLTLNALYPVLVGGEAKHMTAGTGAAVADLMVKFAPEDYVASTGVLTYRVTSLDGAAAVADVPNDEWVYFELVFAKRSAGAPTGALT